MNLTYLALGDSYTIGEGVLPEENFPSQAAALYNKTAEQEGRPLIDFPRIIATTGWTTDELDAAIDAASLTQTYDFVSLLIGVNNQYRGRSMAEYKVQFHHLLQTAIGFAAGHTHHVFVLSIPDWGVTPFAEGRDKQQIAKEIDEFNATAKTICETHGILFINITASQRLDGAKEDFLVSDKLHPSAKEYSKWATQLAAAFKNSVPHG